MIIFYKKDTGQIFSVLEGRVHQNPEQMIVQVTGVDQENIGRFIIPYKQKYKEVDTPIYKWFLVDKKTGEVEQRIVGVTKEKVADGLEPDVEFSQLILDFETKKEDIYSYKIVFDKNKNPVGFKKIV